jgi:hypothetical protein
MSKVVKWKTIEKNQWHYGIVISEATDQDPDGPYVEVEYTHSVPASNKHSGRIVRIYGVHKVVPV